MSRLEEYEQSLQKFFKWGESFLSSLHSFSQVNITDLQLIAIEIKVRPIVILISVALPSVSKKLWHCTIGVFCLWQEKAEELQSENSKREHLQQQTESLCASCEPVEQHYLQSRLENSVQPYMQAQQLVMQRGESVEKLEAFLQTHNVAAGVLRGLRLTVESAGTWDKSRVDELQRDLEGIIPDISRLESLAISLDSSLCKAHLHLVDTKEARTLCRSLADTLSTELDGVKTLLGSKQSEAEALGALWVSFRQRKEQLLKSVEDIEEKADQQSLKEPNLLTLQQR